MILHLNIYIVWGDLRNADSLRANSIKTPPLLVAIETTTNEYNGTTCIRFYIFFFLCFRLNSMEFGWRFLLPKYVLRRSRRLNRSEHLRFDIINVFYAATSVILSWKQECQIVLRMIYNTSWCYDHLYMFFPRRIFFVFPGRFSWSEDRISCRKQI